LAYRDRFAPGIAAIGISLHFSAPRISALLKKEHGAVHRHHDIADNNLLL